MLLSKKQIDIIMATLPACIQARRANVQRIICEWARVDLEAHLKTKTNKTPSWPELRKALLKLKQDASRVSDGLAALSPVCKYILVRNIQAPNAGDGVLWVSKKEREDIISNKTEQVKEIVFSIEAALKRGDARPHFRPSTRLNYCVMQDLAAVYEYATKKGATRRMGTDTSRKAHAGEDYGPFWDFASRVWKTVFGSKDGCSQALKRMSKYKNIEASALIAHMACRYPEWQLY